MSRPIAPGEASTPDAFVTWRLCKRKYVPDCLNGEGARLHGGRWNSRGQRVVYTSGSLSLATLELFVHVDPNDVPADLMAVPVRIPSAVAIQTLDATALPASWRAIPQPPETAVVGDTWLKAKETAVLSLPSVVVPCDRNYLINPLHPDARQIDCGAAVPFEFDPRMWK